jgi:hypothetical protein
MSAVPDDDLVPLWLASASTGAPQADFLRWIASGKWREGFHYKRDGDRLLISRSGFVHWIENGSGEQEPARATKRRAPAADKPTRLYRHFDADGVLLYVGISLSAVYRLTQHMSGSRWAEEIARVDVQTLPDRAAAEAAERAAIADENPKYNLLRYTGRKA